MQGLDLLKEGKNIMAAGVVKKLDEIKQAPSADVAKKILIEIIADKSYNAAPQTRNKWLKKISVTPTLEEIWNIAYNFVLAAQGMRVIQ